MKKITISLLACGLLSLPLLRSTEDVGDERIAQLCSVAQELAEELPQAQAAEIKLDIAQLADELEQLGEQGDDEQESSTWRTLLASFIQRLQYKVGAGRLSRGPVEHLVDTVDSWLRTGIAGAASTFAYRRVQPKYVMAGLHAVIDREPLTDALQWADDFEKRHKPEEQVIIKQLVSWLTAASVFVGTRGVLGILV